MFQSLTKRQALSVVALVVLLLVIAVAVAAGSRGSSSESPSDANSACLVNGDGNKLCGGDAQAYCAIHYADYQANDETDSMDACDSVGYQAPASTSADPTAASGGSPGP